LVNQSKHDLIAEDSCSFFSINPEKLAFFNYPVSLMSPHPRGFFARIPRHLSNDWTATPFLLVIIFFTNQALSPELSSARHLPYLPSSRRGNKVYEGI
jgi:hypothetical protein